MDGRRRRGPGVARLLVLCAVLLGLFFMHGAPANAAEGCHGSTAMVMSPGTGHGEDVRMDAAALRPPGATAPGASAMAPTAPPAHGVAMPGMSGELCVSTPARDRTPLPATGLLALLGLVALVAWHPTGRSGVFGEPARRGPPLYGRHLLLQVCVART
ncbi:hypothetical protein AQJ43_21915 [Streptomyces avermitilis]|uniref:Secreted protein n=2 Tax=Streptomyces avermitilis TaxID=33903 RepID=Q82E38_STRAW|nr:hypothetical protein [Streptomyces avermitilis]MYT00362.1 hypothetical protein [Streptomyces sp. SID5469]KUN52476.1 hypothetical protein AQJ43_21915 [Streptomyces avermitilis]OOV31462.1 hypothetical protein SM007_00495 [Streptomyces avermitilis]BAC72490.1 putative secreted protein [Streptomyces avermitilis MA-4680 = NBRC 14893]BBJ52843.1 hypothetical protein SAVMC3_54720 [Streptomyces avermitilis]